MTFDTDDIPYLHPLAANFSRMFAADFVKRNPLPEDVAQDLANTLGFATHLMLTQIESTMDTFNSKASDSIIPEVATYINGYTELLKQAIREVIRVDWSDDEDGGETVRIAPKVLV